MLSAQRTLNPFFATKQYLYKLLTMLDWHRSHMLKLLWGCRVVNTSYPESFFSFWMDGNYRYKAEYTNITQDAGFA